MAKKGQRGGATIFFCVLLSVMLPLAGILTDLVRYRLACGQVREAVRLTADSILAGYDRPMREEYGLFSIACGDEALLRKRAESILTENLAPMRLDGVRDLYGFRVESLQLVPLQNLSEGDVLKKQVAEFMKYRAPLRMAAGFIEKFKAFNAAADETAVIQTDMALDREMAAIRRDTVYLSLLAERMRTLGTASTEQGSDLMKHLEGKLTANHDVILRESKTYADSAAMLEASLPERDALAGRLSLLNAEVSTADQQRTEAVAVTETIEKALEKLLGRKGMGEEEKKEKERLVLALADAKAVENARSMVCSRVHASLDGLEAEVERFAKEIWQPAHDSAEQALEQICRILADDLEGVMEVEEHLKRHRAYLSKTMELVDALISQSEAFTANLSVAFDKRRMDNAGASKGTLQATKTLLPIPPDPAGMRAMRGDFDKAGDSVDAWLHAASVMRADAESSLRTVQEAMERFVRAGAAPGDAGSASSSGSFPSLPENPGLADIQTDSRLNSLGHFSTYGRMESEGVYRLPTCLLTPQATEAEQVDYADWFMSWSGEPLQTDENGSDGQNRKQIRKAKESLRELRNAAGKTAKGVQQDSASNRSEKPVINPEEAALLPSGALGQRDSSEALARIGAIVGDSGVVAEALLPLLAEAKGSMSISEHNDNLFTRSLDCVVNAAKKLGTSMKEAPGAFLEDVYMNTYILSAFKNATGPVSPANDIGWGRNQEDTAFDKGEVEYVLFGRPDESGNLGAMKGALFASRLAMNLVHVYTTPAKESATLGLATALAGWTVFGVPVVQNFLMVSWAAAESCLDVVSLCKGEDVPLVKTTSNWILDPGGIRGELIQNLLLNPAGQAAARVVEEGISKADEAVRETVGGWVDAGVDEAFAPIEAGCGEAGQIVADGMLEVSAEIPDAITRSIDTWVDSFPVMESSEPMMERFETLLRLWLETFRRTCAETVRLESAREVAAMREDVKEEIKRRIFQSACYRGLVKQAEDTADALLNGGLEAIDRQADNIFGEGTGISGLKAGVAGRVMEMGYTDYLALYLMMVPSQVKTARAGDLMQMNLKRMVEDAAIPMMDRNTAIFLRAEVSMDFWFLPDRLLRRYGLGTLSAEWGQSY